MEADPDLEAAAEEVPRCSECRHFRWAKCGLHARIVDPDDTCKDHEEEVRSPRVSPRAIPRTGSVPHRAAKKECFT